MFVWANVGMPGGSGRGRARFGAFQSWNASCAVHPGLSSPFQVVSPEPYFSSGAIVLPGAFEAGSWLPLCPGQACGGGHDHQVGGAD